MQSVIRTQKKSRGLQAGFLEKMMPEMSLEESKNLEFQNIKEEGWRWVAEVT